MSRMRWVLILLPLALTGCGGEEPNAPVELGAVAKSRPQGATVFPAGTHQNPHHQSEGWQTWQTWKSAYRVERAVQEFARDNEGWFPRFVSDSNSAGMNLIDYLPDGQLLLNAFTGVRSEPQDEAAAYPGAIGYQVIHDNGYPAGYTISAMGADPEQYLELEHRPD